MTPPKIFSIDDFRTPQGEWINPAHVLPLVETIFEIWFKEQFTGRRVWIPKDTIKKGIDCHTKAYEPDGPKELPPETQFSEWIEKR